MPYWSSDIDIEVSRCLSWGLDYKPVSGGVFLERDLRKAAAACLNHGSELLFIASQATGCIGAAVSDNFYAGAAPGIFIPGFIMLLSHSDIMEHMIIRAILNYYEGLLNEQERHKIIAGITRCSLWDAKKLVSVIKAIAVTSPQPFFNPAKFLESFAEIVSLPYCDCMVNNAYYYAEKFGIARFNMLYDADYNPYNVKVSSLLHGMKLDETKLVVGDSPEIDFPDFIAAGNIASEIDTRERRL